ncbi:hypothetical protein OF83DRAFT_181057 [Amylostereum chailletii]|nr:hypothetical protein OF83DRAFT_181057 [Amylostereum chailletii]
MPFLFRHYAMVGAYGGGPCPPPAHVSPFVQIFSFSHIGDITVVQHFFRSSVHLPSVTTIRIQDAICGVPIACLACCEVIPTLHSLEITDTQLTTLNPPNVVMSNPTLHSLSRFVYSINQWVLFGLASDDNDGRGTGMPLAISSRSLRTLLEPMRGSLQSVELTSHHGLFSWMASVRWPRLRELCFDGMYLDKDDVRAIRSLISNLPDLQVLGLKLARAVDAEEPILVKRSNSTSVTLRYLEKFTIAFPSPADGIFDLLPSKLRHLSLRDWPRYYFMGDPASSPTDLAMPILSASECLAILRRCHCPHLRSLEVVYRAGDEEDALLGYIVSSFPSLTMFELHRYRASADEEVPMEHIVQILAGLNSLCSLRLNLDLPTHQLHPYIWTPFFLVDPVKNDMIYRAKQCAGIIGPSLKEVSFILRLHVKNEWRVWGLQRSKEGVVGAVKENTIHHVGTKFAVPPTLICGCDVRGN